MKRHLTLLALSLCAAPLPAQEPYAPAYGYESNDNTRQFNFNPGNMMNRMGNPMRSMFGSSNRGYDDYPPSAYPPAYGYPAYPAPQQPYADYGYMPQQPPSYPAYTSPYGYPQAEVPPAQPAPPASRSVPGYDSAPPSAMGYRPDTRPGNQSGQYRFRPLDHPAPPATSAPAAGGYAAPAMPPEPVAPPPPPTVMPGEYEPLAPLTYPEPSIPEPLAPFTSPNEQTQAPQPQMMDSTQIPQDPGLKFRPLDQPGYSSELDQ